MNEGRIGHARFPLNRIAYVHVTQDLFEISAFRRRINGPASSAVIREAPFDHIGAALLAVMSGPSPEPFETPRFDLATPQQDAPTVRVISEDDRIIFNAMVNEERFKGDEHVATVRNVYETQLDLGTSLERVGLAVVNFVKWHRYHLQMRKVRGQAIAS